MIGRDLRHINIDWIWFYNHMLKADGSDDGLCGIL